MEAEKILGRSVEHEYGPRMGDFGRAFGFTIEQVPDYIRISPSALISYLKYNPLRDGTVGLKPEDVDLTGYTRYALESSDGSRQDVFAMYGPSGGITNGVARYWVREEAGIHYVIVFEACQ